MRRGFSPYSMLMKNDYFKKKRNVLYEKKVPDELNHEDLADWEKMYEAGFRKRGSHSLIHPITRRIQLPLETFKFCD